MPKMKTRRAAVARFSVTGKGKIKLKKQGLRHILEKRSKNSKNRAQKAGYAAKADVPGIKKMLAI